MSLFTRGDFKLASGRQSSWKVECDALTPEDWDTLALLAALVVGPFGSVVGVPRGGLPFADALRPLATHGPRLVCDDVLTTGGSLLTLMEPGDIGVVAFARGALPPSVRAVWAFTAP